VRLAAEEGVAGAASAWYQKAIDVGVQGEKHAMLFLGCLLRDQGDLQGAREWLLKAADAGYASMTENVHRLPVAEDASLRYQRDISNAYVNASSCLGEVYRELGEEPEARPWLERAAHLGHPTAMNELGKILWAADDFDAALIWFRPAAELGVHDSMFYLGMILDQNGDSDAAGIWLEKAANGGAPHAMGRYGVFLYEQGDLSGARAWCERAQAAGDPFAAQLLEALPHQPDTRQPEAPNDSSSKPTQGQRETDHGSDPSPNLIHWTPMEHTCGCVID